MPKPTTSLWLCERFVGQSLVPVALKNDLHDALKWLFVGGVTWHAHPLLEKDKNYMRALGMFTCLVQAYALYEFFNNSDQPARLSPGGPQGPAISLLHGSLPILRASTRSTWPARNPPRGECFISFTVGTPPLEAAWKMGPNRSMSAYLISRRI